MHDHPYRATHKRGPQCRPSCGAIPRPRTIDGQTIIRWLDLSVGEDGYTIVLYEVFDDGSPDYLDVYSFGEVAPDDEPPRHSFTSLDDALAFAVTAYNAPRNNYVSQGIIQAEYAAFLRNDRND